MLLGTLALLISSYRGRLPSATLVGRWVSLPFGKVLNFTHPKNRSK
jgi:hypothetical protein